METLLSLKSQIPDERGYIEVYQIEPISAFPNEENHTKDFIQTKREDVNHLNINLIPKVNEHGYIAVSEIR